MPHAPMQIFSLRISEKQKLLLQQRAKSHGLSVSAYGRMMLLSETIEDRARMLADAASDKELAQILAVLGQTRIANNLNQIAKAINTGTLIISPDVIKQINESYDTVLWIRATLIKALGLKA